jgi:hypothetical protein
VIPTLVSNAGAGSPVKDSAKDGEAETTTAADGAATEVSDLDSSERSEGDAI